MTVRILRGDVRAMLKMLPDESVHCVVTSPPYWGLRSYLPEGHPDKHLEIGSEPTVEQWVATMVEVFREVRRVLRPDGTLWLNLGDSYASNAGGYDEHGSRGATSHPSISAKTMAAVQQGRGRVPAAVLKPKDLIGQPWRVAFALQADGWWLRQEIIWSKPNPMPESVRDRCTKAHEHIFLLSKSERYFYDFEAMQEPCGENTHPRRAGPNAMRGQGQNRPEGGGRANREGRDMATVGWGHKTPAGCATGDTPHNAAAHQTAEHHRKVRAPGNKVRKLAEAASGTKNNDSFDDAMAVMPATRNPRSVWTIATEPFSGAHFATFPSELPRRCITAGCPPGGTVLDPFGGSGTTGLAADQLGRHAILIDLDERNVPMARQRIEGDAPLLAEVAA